MAIDSADDDGPRTSREQRYTLSSSETLIGERRQIELDRGRVSLYQALGDPEGVNRLHIERARTALPCTDPLDSRYASIVTGTPGIDTDFHALIRNRCRKGTVIYGTGVIESWEDSSRRRVLAELIRIIGDTAILFFPRRSQRRGDHRLSHCGCRPKAART